MINNLTVSGIHTTISEDVSLYIDKKIGGLFKYMPKSSRESAHVDVKLKEAKSKDKRSYECEVIMKLKGANITGHRKSSSMLAAIDEVEDNLKNQLRRYKSTHSPSKLHRHLISRFRNKELRSQNSATTVTDEL